MGLRHIIIIICLKAHATVGAGYEDVPTCMGDMPIITNSGRKGTVYVEVESDERRMSRLEQI